MTAYYGQCEALNHDGTRCPQTAVGSWVDFTVHPSPRYCDPHLKEAPYVTYYRNRMNNGDFDAKPNPDESTVADLKDQLRELGQPTSGSKAELVARIEEARAAQALPAVETSTIER